MKVFRQGYRFFVLLIGVYGSGCVSGSLSLQLENTNVVPVNNQQVYDIILQAHYLSFSGKVEEGYGIFQEGLVAHPSNSELRYQYAKFLLDLVYRTSDISLATENLNSAKAALRTAIDLNPNFFDAYKLLVEVLVELGELNDAIDVFERLIDVDASDQKVKADLARLYVHSRLPEKAVSLLKPIVENEEISHYDVLKVYGLACAEAQLMSEAISSYTQYLTVFPDEFEASFNLALCYFKVSDYENAETILERMKASGRFSIEAAELYVDVLKALNKFDKAIDLLLEIRNSTQFEVAANIEIGQIHLSLGKPTTAYEYLSQAVLKAPNDRRATFYAALALSESGRFSEALRMLENNLEDKPVSIPAADLAIDILVKAGVMDAALAMSRRLISERDDDVRAYLIAYRVLDHAGLTQESITVLQKAADQFPDHLSINMALVYHLEQSGAWEIAIQKAQNLLDEQPGEPEIANFIGYVLADKNQDLPRALELIRLALSSEPENPAYLDSLAWVLHRLGQNQEALSLIRQAAEKLPDDLVVMEHLIHILLSLNLADEAKQVIASAQERLPDNDAVLRFQELLNEEPEE